MDFEQAEIQAAIRRASGIARDAFKTDAELRAEELAKIRARRAAQDAAKTYRTAYAAEFERVASEPTPAVPAPVLVTKEPLQTAPAQEPEILRKPTGKVPKWLEIAGDYITEVMIGQRCATAKELYKILESKAGPGSPFERGTGNSRGCLFVRETMQTLSLKTLQNNWQRLRELAQK